jgi:hypothetical protein
VQLLPTVQRPASRFENVSSRFKVEFVNELKGYKALAQQYALSHALSTRASNRFIQNKNQQHPRIQGTTALSPPLAACFPA